MTGRVPMNVTGIGRTWNVHAAKAGWAARKPRTAQAAAITIRKTGSPQAWLLWSSCAPENCNRLGNAVNLKPHRGAAPLPWVDATLGTGLRDRRLLQVLDLIAV